MTAVERWVDARRAERSSGRLALVHDLAAGLARADDVPAVVEVVVTRLAAAFGAEQVVVGGLDEDGVTVSPLGSAGDPGGLLTAAAPGLPAGSALLRAPDLRVEAAAHRTLAVLPLVVTGRAVGVLVLGWSRPRRLPSADEALLAAVARLCAQAVDRARLHEAERLARRGVERLAARLEAQAELSRRLARQVDVAGVTEAVLDFAVDRLGAETAWLVRPDPEDGPPRVLGQRGQPAEVDLGRLARWVVDEGRPVTARGGLTGVPLRLDDRLLGVLCATELRTLDPTGGVASFLDALALQCAQALDRALLFERTRDVAATLRRSLLPARLPVVPGLEMAVRYRPRNRVAEVGGDFYDAFRVPGGRWGIVLGDVSGKDVTAATLIALVRHTVRTAARTAAGPSAVLAVLNEAVLEATEGDLFCTLVYLEVRPSPDGVAARLSVGGHPLPMLLHADGSSRPVGRPGTAIGVLPAIHTGDDEVLLGPGDGLVLVTDGIEEARSPEGRFAEGLVARVLAGCAGADAPTVADRLERAALDFSGGRPVDDLAVLVLQVPAGRRPWLVAEVSHTLDGDQHATGRARRLVREFLAEHGLGGAAADTVLVVSELVGNAVQHAGTAVGLRVAAIGDRLRVEVADGSPGTPLHRAVAPTAAAGRGLLLVDRLSAAWGVSRTTEGKVVWAELSLGGAPAAAPGERPWPVPPLPPPEPPEPQLGSRGGDAPR